MLSVSRHGWMYHVSASRWVYPVAHVTQERHTHHVAQHQDEANVTRHQNNPHEPPNLRRPATHTSTSLIVTRGDFIKKSEVEMEGEPKRRMRVIGIVTTLVIANKREGSNDQSTLWFEIIKPWASPVDDKRTGRYWCERHGQCVQSRGIILKEPRMYW